jgi:hypothetical protein
MLTWLLKGVKDYFGAKRSKHGSVTYFVFSLTAGIGLHEQTVSRNAQV